MSDGSVNSNSRWEDVCKQNRSEIAALQRGQVETMAMINEHQRDNQSKFGSMETSLKRMEKMLTESLKLKHTNLTSRSACQRVISRWILITVSGRKELRLSFPSLTGKEWRSGPSVRRSTLSCTQCRRRGLTEALKCELFLAKPKTYGDAIALAKLHEQKSQNWSMTSRPSTLTMPNASGKPGQPEKSVTSPGSTNSTTTHRRLSAAEIKQRRDKGICYY
ncbi:hypothetical protein PIB30_031349 [Stylosanthes scabra]|uniref:Uncharacterized protein n=1 Tax=Stylosanthes scabra TaxID=79078 RepID=A0ABU6UC31_9FABA|nr:hypothetical protein [Stylosanthes scabra]